MAKILLYLTIISVMLIGCHLLGFIEDDQTANSVLLGYLLRPNDMEKINLTVQTKAGIGLVIGSGLLLLGASIIAGRPDLAAVAPIAPILLSYCWDVIIIYTNLNKLNPLIGLVSLIIFSPLILLTIISSIDWWRMNN
jgi:hypothetical protein